MDLPDLPQVPMLWTWIESMHFVLKMGIFQPAMLVYLEGLLNWAVLSGEQMSKRWPFSLLNNEQG